MKTLKDFETAFTQSIKPLNDLAQDIAHELQHMELEEAEDILQGQFLIGLYELTVAAIFLSNKRDEIRKMMDDHYDLKRRGDHMDKIVEFEGRTYIGMESDGRYVCKYAFVEEVDFGFLVSGDGKQILVPVGIDMLPAVVCGLNLEKNEKTCTLKECHGCKCEHFVNGFEGEKA